MMSEYVSKVEKRTRNLEAKTAANLERPLHEQRMLEYQQQVQEIDSRKPSNPGGANLLL